jgi:D-sedoheptulose 7-phosphate isomerase
MSITEETQIFNQLTESSRVIRELAHTHNNEIAQAVELISTAFLNGNKLLICGNGGSAADSQHLAAEFMSRYRLNRVPLPTIALTTDSSFLTAHSNDFGFDDIYDRQIKGLGKPGDVLLAISTSGKSLNVLRGILRAWDSQMLIVGLTGAAGFVSGYKPNVEICVPSKITAHIQEGHMAVYHVIADLVERALFEAKPL